MTTELHHGVAKMTVEDWAALPEDDQGELVDGQLVEEEMPDALHEMVVSWLIGTLRAWIVARGGFVFGSELKYALRKHHGRKPDVSLYLPGSDKPRRRGAVRVPPDLMVEVLSPSPRDDRRDRVEKFREYARFGVKCSWIVDPEAKTIEGYDLMADGRYARTLSATDGKVTVPGLDGLELDLDALWAETDKLADE